MTHLFWFVVQPFRYLRQNISNLIYARQDCSSRWQRDFFWHELNIGWHEMCEACGIETTDTNDLGEVTV